MHLIRNVQCKGVSEEAVRAAILKDNYKPLLQEYSQTGSL